MSIHKAPVDQISFIYKFHTTVDVLRLDQVHPIISGNKWFKLHEYVREAQKLNKKILGTFGGPYSNHILATAAAAASCNMKSIGIIRGETPPALSATLLDASALGMELIFVSRTLYRQQHIPQIDWCDDAEIFWIREGGYGYLGARGAQDIIKEVPGGQYDFLITAVGTGTTAAGLTQASEEHQQIIGIPVMKNNDSLHKEINHFISHEKQGRLHLIQGYHFGGYAKKTNQLIAFMNDWFTRTGIPSDFVYTGKLFFAINDLLLNQYFEKPARVLIIHSGGLQGNRSLPKGTLIF